MAEAPPYPEEVTLGDPTSPVAICTLWTRQERILRGVPRELYAACGNLYSLWGINLLLRGVLARPTLRYLLVCGIDYADTGRALVALYTGEAAVAPSPTPAVPLDADLDATTLARFRQQVTLVDLRGCTEAARVVAALGALPPPADGPRVLVPPGWSVPTSAAEADASPLGRERPPAPSGAGVVPSQQLDNVPCIARCSPQGEGAPALAPTRSSPSSVEEGAPPKAVGSTWQPDPHGNFLIAVQGEQLIAAHATTADGPTGPRFVGRTAAEVYRAILGAGLVSRLDHAAYLGAELTRAETALRLGLPYRQDRPLALPRT